MKATNGYNTAFPPYLGTRYSNGPLTVEWLAHWMTSKGVEAYP